MLHHMRVSNEPGYQWKMCGSSTEQNQDYGARVAQTNLPLFTVQELEEFEII